MKTIIVGTDFSQSSLNDYQYAAFLAQKAICKLLLLNLFEAPVNHSNTGLYEVFYQGSSAGPSPLNTIPE